MPIPSREKKKLKYPKFESVYSFNEEPDYLEIQFSGIENLPFVNHSHFELLLDSFTIEEIVKSFTYMLFESKTLLIAPQVEQLVPISFALHSLIYPFKMCLFVPCLLNDGEDDE